MRLSPEGTASNCQKLQAIARGQKRCRQPIPPVYIDSSTHRRAPLHFAYAQVPPLRAIAKEAVMFFKVKSDVAHLTLLVGLILFACGPTLAQDVHYNFMPGTDFSKYHTYKWIDIPENVHPN